MMWLCDTRQTPLLTTLFLYFNINAFILTPPFGLAKGEMAKKHDWSLCYLLPEVHLYSAKLVNKFVVHNQSSPLRNSCH